MRTISPTAAMGALLAGLVVAIATTVTDAGALAFYSSLLAIAIVFLGLQARADRRGAHLTRR